MNPAEHREDKAVTAITDDIIGFIETNRDKPWFAYAAQLTPHAPFAAPRALVVEQMRGDSPAYRDGTPQYWWSRVPEQQRVIEQRSAETLQVRAKKKAEAPNPR